MSEISILAIDNGVWSKLVGDGEDKEDKEESFLQPTTDDYTLDNERLLVIVADTSPH